MAKVCPVNFGFGLGFENHVRETQGMAIGANRYSIQRSPTLFAGYTHLGLLPGVDRSSF
jgi:hypothetical protein